MKPEIVERKKPFKNVRRVTEIHEKTGVIETYAAEVMHKFAIEKAKLHLRKMKTNIAYRLASDCTTLTIIICMFMALLLVGNAFLPRHMASVNLFVFLAGIFSVLLLEIYYDESYNRIAKKALKIAFEEA